MRNILVGLGVTLVIGFAIVLFIQISSTISANKGAKILENEDNGLTQEEVEEGLNLQENGADGTYVVNLLSGSFEGEVEGVVLTDKYCKPDKEGISRCHNEIKLNEQENVTIVNPHNMKKNRCLSSDETVRLSKNKEGKVIVELLDL